MRLTAALAFSVILLTTTGARATKAAAAGGASISWPVIDDGAERETTTPHQLSLNGKSLTYDATVGTLRVDDAKGKPQVSLFYVAYTLKARKGEAPRPVTFLFNGGPGSSSIWLHMGSFGPMRVRMPHGQFMSPAPFALEANPDTLLDETDLVFLDAPNAGFSRAIGSSTPADFYGIDSDIGAFAGAIRRYVTRYHRWSDPKFILGESYGTTRASALTYRLQQRGMVINGTILMSSVLNWARYFGRLDDTYASYIPTYAALAQFHNKVPGDPGQRVEDVVAKATAFARGDYMSALAKGGDIAPEERDRVAREMANLVGLPADYISRANLRVTPAQFEKELLRGDSRIIGELDGRFASPDANANGEVPSFDPSYRAINGALIGSFMNYLSGNLGVEIEAPYNVSAEWAGDFSWNYSHVSPSGQQEPAADVSEDLAQAMRTNPYLRVLVLSGYYDLSTPLLGTEMDVSHMLLTPAERSRLRIAYFPAGHMLYADPDVLPDVRANISKFIDGALRNNSR